MAQYLVGTGGWSYFRVPNKDTLKAYSKVYNFVEVNYTFYEYPPIKLIEKWRSKVPSAFVFAVRCHQDLTHRIGLKPTDAAFEVFYRMKAYCKVLESPYLVLETPTSQTLDGESVAAAKDFFATVSARGLKLIWEYRAPWTALIASLMQDLGIIQCVDLSVQKPTVHSDVVYSRLFGKGKHNIYQFTDDELVEINRRAEETGAKEVVLAYHGPKMHSDALRFAEFKKTGKFIQATDFTGAASARAVLAEDAFFPLSKAQLIRDQGWKVIDLTADLRVHLADELSKIPEKTYSSLDEVVDALEAAI